MKSGIGAVSWGSDAMTGDGSHGIGQGADAGRDRIHDALHRGERGGGHGRRSRGDLIDGRRERIAHGGDVGDDSDTVGTTPAGLGVAASMGGVGDWAGRTPVTVRVMRVVASSPNDTVVQDRPRGRARLIGKQLGQPLAAHPDVVVTS